MSADLRVFIAANLKEGDKLDMSYGSRNCSTIGKQNKCERSGNQITDASSHLPSLNNTCFYNEPFS